MPERGPTVPAASTQRPLELTLISDQAIRISRREWLSSLRYLYAGSGFGLDTEDSDATSNATIVTTDIEASNGIVHKIDFVLLPN